MGTGHSIDSPIRVAPYGITSVLSVVDDLLVEKIRKYYSNAFDLPYKNIARNAEDGRARRITAYLDMVHHIVHEKFDTIRKQPFFQANDKQRYFELLPDVHPLKAAWNKLHEMSDSHESKALAEELNNRMQAGSIDVNIMAKVDRLTYDGNDRPLSAEYSDASSALRGFANSVLESSLVLSAGFNPRLYGYLSEFKDFYRDKTGHIKKKIILKVSDFRSALIQGKFLAKKGIEVAEFRIESGLNCGGHAFASDGELLPVLLKEFREKRDQLKQQFQPLIDKFYESMGWEYPEAARTEQPLITVQGGIGAYGETRRLMEDFAMDRTGWGSPFLLVPEATCVDEATLRQLADAGEDELYLSNVSPLGVPFNNMRNTGSEQWTRKQIEKGKPGSGCPKGFLQTNTEFTEKPICTASSEYQLLKIDQINHSDATVEEKENRRENVLAKTCLCDHLGNGALIKLGLIREKHGPQSICPGPNVAWFKGPYSLREMVDHIYGRASSLVPEERPHMFAKELTMYVDYFKALLEQLQPDDKKTAGRLKKIYRNLNKGIDYCREIAGREAYAGENLDSLARIADEQQQRLGVLYRKLVPEPATVG